MYNVGEQGKYSIFLLKKDVIAVTSFLVVRGIMFYKYWICPLSHCLPVILTSNLSFDNPDDQNKNDH